MKTPIQTETFYDVDEMVRKISSLEHDGQPVLIFDSTGNPIDKMTLQEVTLTDGSIVYNLVLHS